jgi:DNA replication and repair protein RecF
LSFVPHPDINAFIGLNGMGKTNILDAVHYLCLAKSNFGRIEKNNILFGEDFFRLKAKIENKKETNEIVIKYSNSSPKTIEKDKKELDKISDHIGNFPVVIITPNDKNDLLENSSMRRNFINKALSQTNRNYLETVINYNKILQQRNAYLKSCPQAKIDLLLLETYDMKMKPLADSIYITRDKFINDIKDDFLKSYNEISDGNEIPEIVYISQLKNDEFLSLSKRNLSKDIQLKRTNTGIHKDDIDLILNNKNIKHFGSQGQLKSFLLAVRLAEYSYLKNQLQNDPILILDDIFDKLDNKRLKKLVAMIFNKRFGQVFISDADKLRIEEIFSNIGSEHRIFEVQDGNIIKIYE